MAGRKVLVTGGAGYVGSVLVNELLKAGRHVRVLDALIHGSVPSLLLAWGEDKFEFLRADLRDPHSRREALRGVDEVIHLAAIVGDPACEREPELARSVNLQATRELLADAADAGVERLLFASTCSNYGKMAIGDEYATEDWELRPVSLYAQTKVAAELEVLGHADDGLVTCCLRLATVYGVSPRMRFDLTVNEFSRDLLLQDELLVFGEQFWRPYIHARDAAEGLRMALEAPAELIAGEVFNVGSTSENYRKSDLVEILRVRIPEGKVRFVHRDEDPRDYRVSFRKLEDRLGFHAVRTVTDGVDEVIALLGSGLLGDPFAPVYRN